MHLSVLGNHGPFAAYKGACSGYLLECGGKRILLDCGSGVLARLMSIGVPAALDTVILSHLHSDHMADMLIMRYALDIMQKKNMWTGPLKVYAPPTPEFEYGQLTGAAVFDVQPVYDGMALQMGHLGIRFDRVSHPVEGYATTFTDGNKKLVYTGDTNAQTDLRSIVSGADLLLCDAGLLTPEKAGPEAPHLSPAEAAEIAQAAGVKRLMLTHFSPLNAIEAYRNEAVAIFPGAECSAEGVTYPI